MKKLTLLSLVGITLIALTQAGWAAIHGGGGGHFGGGGFGGGPAIGGGAPRGGGFGGARFSLPAGHFSTIPPGHSFSSFGTRPSYRQPVYAGRVSRLVTPSARATAASNRQPKQFAAPGNRGAQISRSMAAKPSVHGPLSARNHIFARQDGNAHRDWDQRHAHYWNGHWWCYDSGAWIGLDAGYYPWDYYPYYAYDYYPYDYYPGYYADVEPTYNNDEVPATADQQPDPTVSAVQSRLANLGYYQGVVDGLFGPDTRAAVTQYQIDNHLSVTASLTTDTLQSLGIQQVATS